MGRTEKRRWLSTVAGIGVPRRDRRGGTYEAYVPDPLARRQFVFESDVAADVVEAEVAIARLDGRATALTDTEALARLLLRAESVASSQIEGLSVSPQRLLRAAASREEGAARDVTALEVLANVDAMAYALASRGKVTPARILGIHRRLLGRTALARHAGRWRTDQNWIGGNSHNPLSAAFVPPPPEEVPRLIDDLCAFCAEDSLPAVAQAAIAHAQFETIHPFADGNGRVGRALIHAILRRRRLTARVTPPISLVLATRAHDYIGALQATRYVGSPETRGAVEGINRWVAIFAAAARRAVADAETFEDRVERLHIEWRARLGQVRSDSTTLILLGHLPGAPILTVRLAEALVHRSFASVNAAVAKLVDVGILRPASASARNRVFEARELIDLFTALERQLASPDGNTRLSRPARRVPARPARS